MAEAASALDHHLASLCTRGRVLFLCGGYLACQLLLFLYAVSISGMEDRLGFVRGRDLQQFYISGGIVASGDKLRLYDQEYFSQKQYAMTPVNDTNREKRPPYYNLYPPTMSLLFAQPATLPYDLFVVLGWLWTVAGYLVAARWLVQDLDPPGPWRLAAWLGILGFHPALVMLWIGQFSWLWLLAFLACFRLRRIGKDWAAGLCLSVLTLKPQFAAAAVLWLVMRPDWRTLAGLLVGFLAQAAVAAAILGPDVWRDYFIGASIYAKLADIYHFTGEYQQATLGTLQAILGREQIALCRALYLAIVLFACVLAFRIVHARNRDYRVEETSVILLVLLALPHLLIYDLVLLLIPIGHFLSLHRDEPARFPLWPGVLLYILTMIAPLYRLAPGFSLAPFAIFAALCILVRRRNSADARC